MTNYRKQRGIAITKHKNQIRRIDDSTYEVRSQTKPGVKYTLTRTARSWDCSCPDDVIYCKHAWALEYRLDTKARADRGRLIYEAGGQVECIAADHYLVKSQSITESYEVRDFGDGWMCSCPDHMYTSSVCKHIQAVQFECGERRIIQPHDDTKCKFCNSDDIIKKGIRGTKQQYGCKTCGRRFIQNLGFEMKHASPDHICTAVDMYFSGLSSRKVANSLKQKGIKTTYKTIQNWGATYAKLMESYVDMIHPHVGEKWRTDELYLKINGERKYLFAMLDSETRFWLAKMVAAHKGNDDVTPMFKKAKEVADKVPATLISDGAANFGHAHKQQYAAKNFLHKESHHTKHIHMAGDMNNNQMESFNGNTVRHREKVTRGLKKDDSVIISGLRMYHNFVRQHLGLPDGQTPAEAAGITVEGANKWMTLIQAAKKSAV